MLNKKFIQGLIKPWLEKGKEDLLFAKAALKENKFYSHVCYLSQQAVEKYLKALILLKKGEITKEDKTHNLIYLAKKCKTLIDLSGLEKELRILSQVYIPARYPDEAHLRAFSEKEAKECLEIAEKILNHIENWIREKRILKKI